MFISLNIIWLITAIIVITILQFRYLKIIDIKRRLLAIFLIICLIPFFGIAFFFLSDIVKVIGYILSLPLHNFIDIKMNLD